MRKSTYRHVRMPNLSIRFLSDVLIGAGLDNLSAFRAAGLEPAVADRVGEMVTGEQELAFQLRFVELTRDRPDLWVQAGTRYTMSAFGAHGWAGLTSPTLDDWARNASDRDLTYTFGEYHPLRTADGDLTGVRVSYADSPAQLVPFSVHRDLVSTVRTLAWLIGRATFPFTIVRVPLAEVARDVSEIVVAPLELNEGSLTLEWDASLSNRPLPFGDPFQHQTWVCKAQNQLRQFRLEHDWPHRVVNVLKAELPTTATLSAVATNLNISTRTLQRRLELGETSFRRLRDLARFELAAEMLSETNLSIGEIARRLGYDEPASFTTAFRRWSGQLPSHYRGRLFQPSS